jgi:hypothetical protein
VAVGRLQNLPKETSAPSQSLLYEEVMVHGVPPDEKLFGLGFHQARDLAVTTIDDPVPAPFMLNISGGFSRPAKL